MKTLFHVSILLCIVMLMCGCTGSSDEPPGDGRNNAAAGDWCAGHSVPESACTICNPELIPSFKAAGDWCAGHNLPESVCPDCGHGVSPPEASSELLAPGTRVRLSPPDLEAAVGVETGAVTGGGPAYEVECTARLDYDRNHFAEVRTPLSGVVREVLVDLGQHVYEGQPLFALDSPEVAHLQGDLRTARERTRVARSEHERQLELNRLGIAPARDLDLALQDLEAAEAEEAATRASLIVAGGVEGDAQGRCIVRAPMAGEVVARPAVLGMLAKDDTVLASIADTTRLWALLDIPESHGPAVRLGARVRLIADGAAQPIIGRLSWLASSVDVHTRTVAARAELRNPGGLLRAQQFVRATVTVDDSETGLKVPRAALQEVDSESVVFVRLERGIYEPRQVTPGNRDGESIEVSGRLEVGELVVTTGSFLLKTELERDDIGAGCCEIVVPTEA